MMPSQPDFLLNICDSPDSEEEEPPLEKKRGSSSESSYEDDEEEIPLQDERPESTRTLVEHQVPVEKMDAISRMTTMPQPRRKRFIPKYEKVEGTYKFVIGEETQMFIEMVVGTDVNAQYPWKMVPKARIMENIENLQEKSELFPFKEELEAYPFEEVYMGYIPDESKDVDEFYICCNKEARDHCKLQSEKYIRRQEKKLDKALQKKAKPWNCLGSDLELFALVPKPMRTLIEVEIKSTFPTHDPDQFDVRDVLSVRDGFIELTPYRQKFYNVYRARVDNATQVGEPRTESYAQTLLRYPQNMWTQSIADALGAYDPNKELSEKSHDSDESSGDEITGTQPFDEIGMRAFKEAFRRLRRPSYITMLNGFLGLKTDDLHDAIELNTVMDIYSNDYPNLVVKKTTNIYDTMTFEDFVCFTDVRAKDKYVSCAAFHPMWAGIVGICYADGSPTIMKLVSTRPDPIQRAVYGLNPVMIWSHIDSLRPKLYLECTREVKVLSFCPFDENLLVGGCVNGQIVIWDLNHKLDNVENIVVLSETREKYRIAMNAHMGWMKNIHDDAVVPATAMSSLATSHTGAITTIDWLSPNFVVTPTGKQFIIEEGEKKSLIIFTGSEDGTIMIWNLSPDNVTFLDNKKIKKSKRVLKRPEGLTTDVSAYTVLDRNLTPCYKLVLGIAGQPQTLPVQTFAVYPIPLKYSPVVRFPKTGRKYFKSELLKQQESDMSNFIFCGSQHGELRRMSWEGHAFNTGEVVNSQFPDIEFKCSMHDGTVTCTQRNPFLPYLTLTVGGKIFAIWTDELKERPLIWKKRPFRLTDGKWSLYKPSILFIATSEGNLETWDLLLRSDQPIVIQTVSGSILTGISIHTLPLQKNMIGVSDSYGSLKMFIAPPIFMLSNPSYKKRMQAMIKNEYKVMSSFLEWQNTWMKNNPQIILEMKRKEGALLAEKEEEKRRLKEEEEKRLEEEAEARRLEKSKVIGPAERWQRIIQQLIERTIAVKKSIDRQQLIEDEKPLQELEIQRLEKEKRVLEIMKNQKTIFNDTVAILFPEAAQKPVKVRQSLVNFQREAMKKEFLKDYEEVKRKAFKLVHDNPYRAAFCWEATLSEGKERRQALNAHEFFLKMHKARLDESLREMNYEYSAPHTAERYVDEEEENGNESS